MHIDDVVAAIRVIRDDDRLSGPINIASPNPSDNRSLMRTLRQVVGAAFGLPTRRWMLEIGMWALRTESELILKSRWVLPGILTDAGFRFAHTDLEAALTDVYRNRAAESAGPRATTARSTSDVA